MRRSKKFQQKLLGLNKSIQFGEYIYAVNTGNTPLSFSLSKKIPSYADYKTGAIRGSIINRGFIIVVIL